jgi:hypothetical protein
MRVFEYLLRRLPAGIFALVVLLSAAVPAAADTGTYQISNYIVSLEPQSSGQVSLTCEQTWKVLSGDIPWITVGLPNPNFSVENFSGAAARVTPANSGGFYGVRVDLDKDYRPGESFTVRFTVLQWGLLERLTADKKWRINFTPGWYDRAQIDHLQINLISPVDYQSYSTLNPAPTSVNNNIITWEGRNLAAGAKYNISVECLDGGFLTTVAQPVPTKSAQPGPFSSGSNQGGGLLSLPFIIIVVVILFIGLIVFWSARRARQARDEEMKRRVKTVEEEMAQDKKKRDQIEQGFEEYVEKKNIQPDAQGRYYDRGYGNYITPAIWAAIILNQNRQYNNSQVPPPSRPSCACACVACACACACACAGGGAAGCSRKTLHRCPECAKAGKKARDL